MITNTFLFIGQHVKTTNISMHQLQCQFVKFCQYLYIKTDTKMSNKEENPQQNYNFNLLACFTCIRFNQLIQIQQASKHKHFGGCVRRPSTTIVILPELTIMGFLPIWLKFKSPWLSFSEMAFIYINNKTKIKQFQLQINSSSHKLNVGMIVLN